MRFTKTAFWKLFTVALLILAPPAFAADDDAAQEEETKTELVSPISRAKLQVIDDVHDFGVFKRGAVESVTHTFHFKNTGEDDLLITSVKPSCGCTSAKVSSERIPPGKEATLTAAMNTKTVRGKKTVSVTVNTNDPSKPSHRFQIVGTVLNPWNAMPPLVDFGAVGSGEVRKRSVNVTSQYLEDDAIHRIRSIESDRSELAAATLEERIQKDMGSKDLKYMELTRPVEITLVAGNAKGQQQGELLLATSDPENSTVTVTCRWKVEGDIEKIPTRVYVSQVRGKAINRPFTLKSRTGVPFEVKDFEISLKNDEGKFLEVLPQANQPSEKRFLIRIVDDGKTRKKESHQGNIVFKIDHPDEKTVEVPIAAIFRN